MARTAMTMGGGGKLAEHLRGGSGRSVSDGLGHPGRGFGGQEEPVIAVMLVGALGVQLRYRGTGATVIKGARGLLRQGRDVPLRGD